jgi:acetamidase/formamidase
VQYLGREAGLTYDLAPAAPRLVVDPGEPFVVQTEDALNGALLDGGPPTAQQLGEALASDSFNPCSGPIAVRGARPGDVLAVHVEVIDPAPVGVAAVFEGLGPLQDSATYPDCRGPFTKLVGQAAGVATYGALRWPLRPHIGTIAVAPARPLSAGSDANYGQGRFGGNLDCREIAPGNTVLLPVLVDDALLFVGDVHGSMADGELFGTGVETRAELTLRCELRRGGQELPFARVETPTHIVQLCSDRPVEAAIDQAFRWLLAWLVATYDVTAQDAYVLLGIHPDVRIDVYQLIRLGRLGATVGVAVPRSLLEQLS